MAIITVKIVSEDDLTIFTVEGDLSADEILEYSSTYYNENPTKLVLWDATEGTVGNIKAKDFRRISVAMKNHTKKRSGGKTALVGKFNIDFGLSRMYEAYVDFEEIPITYHAFHTVDDAMKWLLT